MESRRLVDLIQLWKESKEIVETIPFMCLGLARLPPKENPSVIIQTIHYSYAPLLIDVAASKKVP